MKTNDHLATKAMLQDPVDITQWLKEEASKLQPGEIIKSSSFLLYDAMSALEVMVPKTDSGITTENDLKLPRLDETFVKSCEISQDRCDAIMLELLCAEATFLKGHGLTDTLFTNIFIHFPNEIQNETLKLFVKATLYTVASILKLVKNCGAYEEEDFIVNQYHFNIPAFSEMDILESLLSKDSLFLKFRLHWMMAYTSLTRRHFEQANHSLEALKNILNQFQPNKHGVYDQHYLGFNPSMNRRLYVHSPPRSIKILNWEETIEEWHRLISHLSWITKVNPDDSPMLAFYRFEYATHFLRFSALPRCCLQYLFYNCEKKIHGIQDLNAWFFSWLQSSGPFPYSYSKLISNEAWNQLSTISTPFILDLLRIFTFNIARQRRLLMKFIRVFNEFLLSCQEFDTQLESSFHPGAPLYCYTNWAISLLFQVKLFIIKWGFDLELYVPFELSTVYSYYSYLLQSYVARLINLSSNSLEESFSTWVIYYQALAAMSESSAILLYHLNLPYDSLPYLQRFGCFKDTAIPYYSYSDAIEKLKKSSLNDAYDGFTKAMQLLTTLRKLDTYTLLSVDKEEIPNYIRTCIRNRITIHTFLNSTIRPSDVLFIDTKLFCSVIPKNP